MIVHNDCALDIANLIYNWLEKHLGIADEEKKSREKLRHAIHTRINHNLGLYTSELSTINVDEIMEFCITDIDSIHGGEGIHGFLNNFLALFRYIQCALAMRLRKQSQIVAFPRTVFDLEHLKAVHEKHKTPPAV